MSSPPIPNNHHISYGPDGQPTAVDLSFVSEGLGLPADKGYGWAQLEFGDRIGEKDSNRYTILRKLGWGSHSSVWLARDNTTSSYVSIKALTGYITELNRSELLEADALFAVSREPRSPHCMRILDVFLIEGRGSAGKHLCLVLPLYGGDVKALRVAARSPLPFPLARRILLHLLRGIAHTHRRGVVHTDLKPDNIFFETKMTNADIDRWLVEDPSRRHEPEVSPDGIVRAAVSQPLPMISIEDAAKATFLLGDFGTARASERHSNLPITAIRLRPPEVHLGGEWDKPADIFTFGCLVFELLADKPLFVWKPNEKVGDEVANALFQLQCATEFDFRAKELSKWPLASHYFNSDCSLKLRPEIDLDPIELKLIRRACIPVAVAPEYGAPPEIRAVGAFIYRCLSICPEERATAEELLKDPWLEGVE